MADRPGYRYRAITAAIPLRIWEFVALEKNGANVLVTATPAGPVRSACRRQAPPYGKEDSALRFQTSDGLTALFQIAFNQAFIFVRRVRPRSRNPPSDLESVGYAALTHPTIHVHSNAEWNYPYTFSGDTLVFDDLKEIPIRYPNIDQGLFHLGSTRIMGILVMMGAKQGVAAIRIVNPHEAIRSTTTITGFSNHRSKTSREPSPLRVSTTG